MTLRKAWQAIVLVATLVSFVASCHPMRPLESPATADASARAREAASVAAAPTATAPVEGRVDWGGTYEVQANPGDVVTAATISFIDTTTNTTVASGKTDGLGVFSLSLAGYSPVNGRAYVLEAVKGLANQKPGSVAARFRTILQWNGTGWLSCTNSAVGGTIVINSLTTALSIESALDSANVPAVGTIGKVNLATTPASLNGSPAYPGHPDQEIRDLAADVIAFLSADRDPVGSVPAIAPSVSAFSPTTAAPNSLVRITGTGFSPSNQVTIGGAPATVLLTTPTEIVAQVPASAITGNITVKTGRGTVTTSANIKVEAPTADTLAISGFSPVAGRPDTVVTLTGAFFVGATPSVTFAAPAGQPAVYAEVTAFATDSLSVIVPRGADDGRISIITPTTTVKSPASFEVYQGDVTLMSNAFTTGAGGAYTLPFQLFGHSVASNASYVYIIGGYSGGSKAEVWSYPILPDGSLGTLRKAGLLNTSRYYSASVIVNGYLYVSGGYNTSSGGLATVERAPINPDGTLGPFAFTVNMQGIRREHRVLASGSNVYMIGGYRDSGINVGYKSDIERYTADSAGNLTYNATYAMNVGGVATINSDFGAEIYRGKILIVGGYIGGGYGNSMRQYVLPINGDGTLANGTYSSFNMTKAYYATQIAIYQDTVFAFGGYNTTNGYHTFVEHADLDTNTGLPKAAWVADRNMDTNPAYTDRPVLVGNRAYVFGGYAAGSGLAAIQSAEINTNKTVTDWSYLGGLTNWRYGYSGQMIGNKAWLFGGYNNGTYYETTEYMEIRSDGTFTGSTVGTQMTSKRYRAASVVAKGYVYMLGGHSGSAYLATVERAKINSDSTLAAWAAMPSAMNFPRYTHTAAYIGSYIYVFGGHTGSAYLSTIERCKVNDDGSLGRFELLINSLPDLAGEFGRAVLTDRFIYLVGGYPQTGTVYIAPIYKDGTVGNFSRGNSLATANYYPATALIGNNIYAFGGWGSTTVVQRAFINADGSLGTWQPWLNTPTRYIIPSGSSYWDSYVYGNNLYLFSGYAGSSSPVQMIAQGTIR
jgi:hypothetical protein